MGKKIKEAMDAERPKFVEGAKANGVDEKKAEEVFALLEKFANYGFNKSHAAAYAVVSYQTGWLKANYPVEFMAAAMNCDIYLTDKLAVFKREIDRMEIEVVPPCVNRSEAAFSVREGRIHYALGALKNVGVEAMKLITEAREDGPFRDLFDFATRVDLRRVGKRPLEMLARSGAFDQLDGNRRKVLESIDGLVAFSTAAVEEKESAQVSLFGEAEVELPKPRLPMPEDWLPTERLSQEHAAVGFYLSGHPLDEYVAPLQRQRPPVMTLKEVAQRAQGGAFIGKIMGTVANRQERKSARGNRFAFVGLSDPTGQYEVTMFSEPLEQYRDLLEPGENVVLTVEANVEGETVKLLARQVVPVDTVVADAASAGLKVWINGAEAMEPVRSILERNKQGSRGPVNLILISPDLPGDVEMTLPQPYHLTPQIKGALRSIPGVMVVEEF